MKRHKFYTLGRSSNVSMFFCASLRFTKANNPKKMMLPSQFFGANNWRIIRIPKKGRVFDIIFFNANPVDIFN